MANDNKDRWYTITTSDGKDHKLYQKDLDEYGWGGYAKAYPEATVVMSDPDGGLWDVDLGEVGEKRKQGYKFNVNVPAQKASQPTKTTTQPGQATQQPAQTVTPQEEQSQKITPQMGAAFKANLENAVRMAEGTQEWSNKNLSDRSRLGLDVPKQQTGFSYNTKINPETGDVELEKGKQDNFISRAGQKAIDHYRQERLTEEQIDEELIKAEEKLQAAVARISSSPNFMLDQARMAVVGDKMGGGNTDPYERDAEYRLLKTRIRQLKQAKEFNRLGAEVLKNNDYLKENSFSLFSGDSWARFGKNAWEGIKYAGTNVENIPVVGGFTSLNDMAQKVALANKVSNGEELTEDEQDLLTAFALADAAEGRNQFALSNWGYMAGSGGVQMLSFMAELALSPTSGLARAGANKATTFVGKKLLKKYGNEGVRKIANKVLTYAAQQGARVAGAVVNGGIVTPLTTQLPKTMSEVLSRNAGQAVIDTDDSGRYVGKGFEGGEEVGDAIIHGIVSQGIENVSEEILAGTGASKGLGKLMKLFGLAKGGARASKFTSSLVDYLTTADDMALKGPVAKWRMAGKFGSPLEEILEEYAAIPMQHAAGLSEYNGTAWEEIKDPETFYNIVAGLSLGMGFMEGSTLLVDKGSKAAARGINNLVTSRRLNKSDIAAQNIFGDRWEGIKETIESYTDDNIGSGINSLLNTFKNADEKQAAWRYLVDLQAYRGANLARQKAHGEEAKNDFAAAQEEALEKGYSTTQALSRINIKKTLDYLSEKNGALIEEGLEYFGSPEALVRDMEGWATPEDIQQVMDYLNAKAMYEGVVTRISDDMEGQIDAMNHNVDERTNKDTGTIQSVTLSPEKAAINHLDPELDYHIVSGEILNLEDGTIDYENSSKNVILIDSYGEKHFVPIDAVAEVGSVFSPDEVKAYLQEGIEAEYATKLKTGEEGIAPFARGDLYTFNDGTWQVQSNNEDEEGGKIVFYNTETGEVRALTRDEAQKAFDAAANIAIAEANGGTPTATPEEASLPEGSLQPEGADILSATADGQQVMQQVDEWLANDPEEASLPEGSLQPEGADILSATADGQQVMQQVDEWLANDPEEVEENINDMIPEQYRDAALAYYQSKLNLQGSQQTGGNTPVVTGTAQPVQPTASAAPKKVELPRNEDGEFEVKKYKKTADANAMADALIDEFGIEDAMTVAQGHRADALNKKTKRPEQKIYAQRDAAYWAEVISRLNELNPQVPVITPQPAGQAPATPMVGGENARAKWDATQKVVGRSVPIRLKDGRKVNGHYVVAPAGTATASHMANFQDNPDFIHNADGRSMNPRDYTQPANQASVTAIANDYQLQNPQIVSEDGIVYDGNGRQIAGDIAAQQGTDSKYIEDLVDNAEMYGIDPAELEGMEHPRLYFQVDNGQLDYSPQTFDMFNASEQKEVGAVEQGTAMAMTVTDPTFNTLSNIIAGVDGGLKGVYRSTVAQREVINAMQEASDIKEVNQQTRPRYFNDADGTLTEAGRILLESALVGKLFGKNAEVIQMLSTMPRVRNAIAQAMPELLENNKLGEYSLIDEVAQAIKAIYSAREAGQSLQDYMLQGDLFEGKAGKEVYGATVELMANILNGDEDVTLQEVLAGSEENDGYNKKAGIALNYGSLLFGDNRSREEIITEIIESINPELAKKYGIRKQAASTGEQAPVVENGGSSSQGEEAAEQPGEQPGEVGQENSENNTPQDNWRFELHYDRETGRVEITREKVGPSGIPIGDGRWRITAKSLAEMRGILENPANNLKAVYDQVEARLHNEEQLEALRKEEQQAKQEESTSLTEEQIRSLGLDPVITENAIDFIKGDTGITKELAYRQAEAAAQKAETQEEPVEQPTGAQENLFDFAKRKIQERREKKQEETPQDIDTELDAALNDFKSALEDFKNLGGDNTLSVSLVGMNNAQIEALGNLFVKGAKLGYTLAKKGIKDLEQWLQRMTELVGQYIKGATNWSDADVREFLMEVYNNTKVETDNGVQTIKEYIDSLKAKNPAEIVGDKNNFVLLPTHRKFIDLAYNALLARVTDNILSGQSEKAFSSIRELRQMAKSAGIEVDANGATDILLNELVERAIVKVARKLAGTDAAGLILKAAGRSNRTNKEIYDDLVALYNSQPTISARDGERIANQQYSTPLPMGYVASMFVQSGGHKIEDVLEPTAGNGMLVVGLPEVHITANEISPVRVANLMDQPFKSVSTQDATQPFEGKKYDAIVANPPFGSAGAKEYDGVSISGLDPQIALNALESMKDDGKAAIIIGGKIEYAANGAWNTKKPFFSYLYDHYNVKGVISMDGSLYAKQGTKFPTLMILIDGRRSEEERAKSRVYPPTIAKALTAGNFEQLYQVVNDIINSNEKTNGYEVLRSEGQTDVVSGNTPGQTDPRGRNGESGARDEGVRGVRGGLESGDQGHLVPVLGDGSNDTGRGAGGRATDAELGVRPDGRVGRGRKPGGVASENSRQGGNTDAAEQGTDGNAGRQGELVDADTVVRGVSSSGKPVLLEAEKRKLGQEKAPYVPHNSAFYLESLAPAGMAEAMDSNLRMIESEVGNIDEFVTKELGYGSIDEMHKALVAEQVDGVAMAIYQMKKGQALIIGDQTGVGKGRQIAALIRWACRQGKKPIFLTKDANLFTDIYRDLVGIGSGHLRPFIFNAASGELPGVMCDKDGNVVYKAPSDAKQKKIFASGMLPGEYDFAVASYSQFNSGDKISKEEAKAAGKKLSKSKSKNENKPTPKATFLRAIAEDNFIFLDESHLAAGEGNTGAYIQSILKKVKACTFASATFAKRPDTMPMYALRTVMGEANVAAKELIEIIKKGGVTLQEIMSRALTSAGQMVRRERDMRDVKTEWKIIDDPATVAKARENYDKTILAFNAIIKFQQEYISPKVEGLNTELADMASTAGLKKGTKGMGVDNPPFVNKTYNYTKQLMLALKVDAIVNEVIREIKAGRHPVIALENTMESLITDNYRIGDVIEDPSFAASLLKGLKTVMQYTVKDAEGNESHHFYAPEDLGPEGEKAYYELEELIRESTKGIFISPLDAIIDGLNKAGFKVGELTGRNTVVVRNSEGQYVIQRRADKNKTKLAREFNSGELDVLILNKSASTGISLHASEEFENKHQRTMIIAQPLSDINDYMQMIGRIDRTGQVRRGYYINLGLPVPAENRFLMMLSTKLKSLNANTTSAQESKSNEVEAPDLLNKYGSLVIVEYLRDNPEVYEKIGGSEVEVTAGKDPLKIGEKGLDGYTPSPDEEDAKKITGRVALLPTEEQERFYDDVVQRYIDLIRYLDETDSNDLKITTLPLRAVTIGKKVSSEGKDPNGDNPFAQNAYVEEVEMDVLRKPMKADEIRGLIKRLNGELTGAEREAEMRGILEANTSAKIQAENERYEAAKAKSKESLEIIAQKIRAREKQSAEEKEAEIAEKTKEAVEAIEAKHNKNLADIETKAHSFAQKIHKLQVGRTFLIPDVLDATMFTSTTPAIFCGFTYKADDLVPSKTKAIFAVRDGRRRIEIPMSRYDIINNIFRVTDENWDAAHATNLDNWDSGRSNEARKTGYIMTGNLIQAVADTQNEAGAYPGQLISYTDMEGNIHDGILMPDNWTPTLLRNSGSPINLHIAEIRNLRRGETLWSTDKSVGFTETWGGILLLLPKAKAKNNKFFTDNRFVEVTGPINDFTNYRGSLSYPVEENLQEVLDVLAGLGVRINVESEDDTRFRSNEADTGARATDKETIREEAQKLADSLNVPVTIVNNVSELPEEVRKKVETQQARGLNVPGVYSNGRVYVILSDCADVTDGVRTILHEIVGHKGLRQLLGDNYKEFLLGLHSMLSESDRMELAERAERNGWDMVTAMDEWIAEKAEDGKDYTFWDKVIRFVNNFLRDTLGIDVALNDADVRYLLWRNRQAVSQDDDFDFAKDRLFRQAVNKAKAENKGNKYLSETVSEEDLFIYLHKENGELDHGRVNEIIKAVEQGLVRVNRLSEQEERGRNTPVAIAAAILVGQAGPTNDVRQSSSSEVSTLNISDPSERARKINIEEAREFERRYGDLVTWCKNNGYWYNSIEEVFDLTEPSHKDHGETESRVYLSKDGAHVIKVIDLMQQLGGDPALLSDMVALNNFNFPSVGIDMLGFMEEDGWLYAVVQQPFIEGKTGYMLWGDKLYEREKEKFAEIGYKPVTDNGKVIHAYSNGAYIMTDVHGSNYIIDESGNLHPIDTKLEYQKADMYGPAGLTPNDPSDDTRTRTNETDSKDDTRFRTTPRNAANNSKSVRQAYDELMRSGRFLAKETLVDYLASVEKLQNLIEKKTGQKLIDTQNVYRRMFSAIRRSEDGVKFFTSFCAEPLYKAIFDIAGNADFSTNKKAERLDRYCRVKHGIERNRDMAVLEHLDEVAQREFSEQMETELSDLTTKAANLSLEINDLIAQREDAKSRADRSRVRDIQDQINLKREELRAVNAEKKGKMRFPEKYGLKSLQTIKEEKRTEWYDAVEAERELRKSIGASWRETQEALDELAEETFGVELGKEYAGVRATLDAMGEKDAYSFVENFENEVGAQKINALWDAIRLASGVSLEKQLETGLVDKDYVIQQQRRYEYYVPLRGFKGVVASDVYDYPGEGVRGVGNPVIAAGGRESEADNCFGNLLSIGYRSITSGNHNQALQAFWNLARSGKSDGLLVGNRVWIENVGTDEDPDWVMAEAEIPDNATAEEVARILEEFEEEMKEKQKLGLAVQQHKGTPLPPYRTLNKAEKNAHHVYVYIGGELRVVTVVGNPRVALALNGVLNPESTQWKWEQTLNNFLAGAFTSDNPSFAAANLVRDTLHSNARVFIMENPKFWAKFTMKQAGYGLGAVAGASLVYNWAKMMNLLQWYGQYQQSGKKLSFNQEASKLRFKGVSGETLKNFVRFMELGGATGYIWAKDDVESLREIESALSNLAHPTKATIKKYNPFRLFEFASEASELVNRFIAFETGLEMGKTEQQAVSDAQELTLNFTRKGAGRKTSQAMTLDTSKMKVGERTKRSLVDALAGISQFGRNHIVFWNAHMQGAYQLKDMAWRHPGKTFVVYAAAPTVMAGLLMPVMNNVLLPGLYAAFGYGDGDDDDKKYNYYDELPDYIRQRNVCIRKPGGGWIMIPLTPEFAAVWSIGDAMGGTQYGRPVKSSEVILPMLDIISPTTIDWNQGMGGVFVGFTPTGLQPIAHTLINRDWKGQKIKNETPWNEGLPEWKRTFNGTSPTLLAASKGWNRLTGGDNDTYISSSVDINPGTMKEFIQGYLGGFGTSTIDLCDYIYGTVDQEAEAARRDARLPIIGRFWLQGTQGQINQRVQSLYYERVGDFSKNVETREREMRKEADNAYLKVDEVEEQLSETSAADIVKYEELEAQKKEYEKIAEEKEKILENYRESDEWQKFEDIKADVGYLKKMMRGKKAADLSEGEIDLMKELIEKVSKK